MRTTVTLDPDVAAMVTRSMEQRGLSFREVINDSLRRALALGGVAQVSTPTFAMGPPRIALGRALQLAGELEDEETLRKLATQL
jgi:hypothetical protein